MVIAVLAKYLAMVMFTLKQVFNDPFSIFKLTVISASELFY